MPADMARKIRWATVAQKLEPDRAGKGRKGIRVRSKCEELLQHAGVEVYSLDLRIPLGSPREAVSSQTDGAAFRFFDRPLSLLSWTLFRRHMNTFRCS